MKIDCGTIKDTFTIFIRTTNCLTLKYYYKKSIKYMTFFLSHIF